MKKNCALILAGLCALASACDFGLGRYKEKEEAPQAQLILKEPFYIDESGAHVPLSEQELKVYQLNGVTIAAAFQPETAQEFSDRVSKLPIGFASYETVGDMRVIDGQKLQGGLYLDSPDSYFYVSSYGIERPMFLRAVILDKNLASLDLENSHVENAIRWDGQPFHYHYRTKNSSQEIMTRSRITAGAVAPGVSSLCRQNATLALNLANERFFVDAAQLSSMAFACIDGSHSKQEPQTPYYNVGHWVSKQELAEYFVQYEDNVGAGTFFYYMGQSATPGYEFQLPANRPAAKARLVNPLSIVIQTKNHAKISFQRLLNLEYKIENIQGGQQLNISGFNHDKTDYHNLVLGHVTVTSQSGATSARYELAL